MSGFVVSKNRLLKGQNPKGKVEPVSNVATASRSMVASLPAQTATEFLQPTAEGTPDTPGIDQRMEALALARLQLKTKAEFKKEIGKLWKTAQQRFLLIGFYLVDAKVVLRHGDFEDMIERELPFSKSVAFQLRTVAEAIGGEKIAPNELPASYSAAYQIVSLTQQELDRARLQGLLKPDVSRDAIIAFKRELRAGQDDEQARKYKRLITERERLIRRLRQIETELKVIGQPPEASAKSNDAGLTSMDDGEGDQNVVLEQNSAD
jgi:hypothetical protein